MEGVPSPHANHQLRQARLAHNWRQRELAEHLGTTVVSIKRWEKGTHQPGAYYRVKLCQIFGKSAEELGFVNANPLAQPTMENDLPGSQDTSPSPNESPVLWSVPYPRNPFFTGREALLQVLHERINRERQLALTSSWAISGLGGIGKTQTVLEYAYRHLRDYTAIFWISAETTETILTSFTTLAETLKLLERREYEQRRMVAAVQRWLTSHQGWLLIFDNVEDPGQVKAYIPASGEGAVLFTSRRQALGLGVQTVNLDTMTLEEGVRFLLRRAGLLAPEAAVDQIAYEDLEGARAIVAAMDGLPLALDQAGAYIEATRCSISEYLRLLQAAPLRLLADRETHAEHPLSVSQTFTFIFEQMKQRHPCAAELLTACAFLAPEAIPEEIFLQGASQWGLAFEELAADPFQFQEAIRTLLKSSLLQRQAVTRTLTIHRLVQAVLKEQLPEEVRRMWTTRVIGVMSHLFPSKSTQHDYWQTCHRLLPQALACVELGEQWQQPSAEYIALMIHIAGYLVMCSRLSEAECLSQRALHLGEHALGQEHPLLARIFTSLAEIAFSQGNYQHAEELQRRALQIWEHVRGPAHPRTATALSNLGVFCVSQGKYAEARSLYEHAIHIHDNMLTQQGPEVVFPLTNLAQLCQDLGKYAEAERHYQRALHVLEQTVEVEHYLLVEPLSGLATLCREQGKYEEAEALYQRALGICEHLLGVEHPKGVEPLNGLATLYREQGKLEEAEALYQRALAILEQQLGPEHHNTADTLHNLAQFWEMQGNSEAEKKCVRSD